MDLTNKIKNMIEARKLSITELSKILGISRPTIYNRLKYGNWKKLEKLELHKIVS